MAFHPRQEPVAARGRGYIARPSRPEEYRSRFGRLEPVPRVYLQPRLLKNRTTTKPLTHDLTRFEKGLNPSERIRRQVEATIVISYVLDRVHQMEFIKDEYWKLAGGP